MTPMVLFRIFVISSIFLGASLAQASGELCSDLKGVLPESVPWSEVQARLESRNEININIAAERLVGLQRSIGGLQQSNLNGNEAVFKLAVTRDQAVADLKSYGLDRKTARQCVNAIAG